MILITSCNISKNIFSLHLSCEVLIEAWIHLYGDIQLFTNNWEIIIESFIINNKSIKQMKFSFTRKDKHTLHAMQQLNINKYRNDCQL